jgi:hypothetical protein
MSPLPKRAAIPNLPKAGEAPPLVRRRRDVRTPPPDRRAFDRWIDRGLALDGYYSELMAALEPFEEGAPSPAEVRAAKELLFRRPADELAASTTRFLEGLTWFERDELYDRGYEDDEGPDGRVIGAAFVASRIAAMLSAFPSGAPGSGEAYVTMLIGEIVAARPSATQVEWATRKVARERTFLPALSEVLKVLDAAATPEGSGAFTEDDEGPAILWTRAELERTVAAAKPVRRLPGCVR